MARSSADDMELRRACQAAVDGSSAGGKHKVVLSIRVAKSRGVWGKSAKLGRQMAKPRVLAITSILFCILSLLFLMIIVFVWLINRSN